jgi:hypothetical protein
MKDGPSVSAVLQHRCLILPTIHPMPSAFLDDLEKDGFFERTSLYLENYKIKPQEVERKLKRRGKRLKGKERASSVSLPARPAPPIKAHPC